MNFSYTSIYLFVELFVNILFELFLQNARSHNAALYAAFVDDKYPKTQLEPDDPVCRLRATSSPQPYESDRDDVPKARSRS